MTKTINIYKSVNSVMDCVRFTIVGEHHTVNNDKLTAEYENV